ncbi:MAG: hypothetical protein ACFE96_10930 [Candidatus Hermodarchaeota archaeon]
MYNTKMLIGEVLGACIAIVWIAFAILGAGNMYFLTAAICLTILLGTASGGLIAVSKKESDYKEVLGWLFGASIGVVWIIYALLYSYSMVMLVIAICLTILFGVLSGGLIKLSSKNKGD